MEDVSSVSAIGDTLAEKTIGVADGLAHGYVTAIQKIIFSSETLF